MHTGTWMWLQGVKREREKREVSNNEREKEVRKVRDEEKKLRERVS